MRVRMNRRLFTGFVGIVGLMGILTVSLLGSGLRRELTATFRGELERQLSLGEWIVTSLAGVAPDSIAREITNRIGYRTTFISVEGVVLGDSYVDPDNLASVENQADRPEVYGAFDGTVSFSQRESATIGDPLLYGAMMVNLDGRPVVLRIAAPMANIDRAVDGVQRSVALSVLLAMVVALAIAYAASRALSQPLVVLAHQASKLARGEFDERTPRHLGITELDDLSVAFNRLADELQVHLSELGSERDETQALIDCMAEGVIALTAETRVMSTNKAARDLLDLPEVAQYTPIGTLVRHPELRSALEESVMKPVIAREVRFGDRYLLLSSRLLDLGGAVITLLDVSELHRLEQVRRDFVANASHELKTPLTSIRGFAETLVGEDPPDELREKFVRSILDNALRMQRLVDDLLDLSHLESDRWIIRPQSVSLIEAARKAWAPYADQAPSRDVAFDLEDDVRVWADPQGLDQILRNLLENALRHTGDGGHIRVTATEHDDGLVHIDVSDDGEGIPSQSLPRIFERFYRADSSRSRDVGGTGLGLAIVRHLVDVMGGSVKAESELGHGTTIKFTLPNK